MKDQPALNKTHVAVGAALLLLVVTGLNIFYLTSDMRKKTDPSKAVAILDDYELYFKKAAPPHFSLWSHFALQQGCLTNPADYAQIYHDLAPWFQNSRRITNESVSHIPNTRVVDFYDGNFHNANDFLTVLLDPLRPLFQLNGKNFRFAVNNYDEPRMLPADAGFTGRYSDVSDVFSHSACYRSKYDSIIKDSHTSDGFHLLFGNASARGQHGFFQKPDSFTIINGNAPVFSQAKLDCFSDVAIPLSYHISIAANRVSDTVPWEHKKPVLFWRGSTTGGNYRTGSPWQLYGRTRLMDWEKKWAAKFPDSTFDAAYEAPPLEKGLNVDVGFSGFAQTDEQSAALINATYGIKGSVNFEKTKQFKYLLVLDGNTWPSRLQSYLQTNSVILYNGIFTDFFNWNLVPWVHYVPVKLDFSDLEERLEWLMAHDAEAKAITLNAQKLMQRWSSMKQLQCYTGFALLEYSNLFEGNTDSG
ncbi:capsule-associated protein CAP1 [Chytriomyces hyalinus]|nr:capsule-associated protein CAP1 [Chytriomyces hyalinus]